MSVEKLYLTSDALDAEAVITAIDAERGVVRLSRTPMHAQGGGQPADSGFIAGRAVRSVRHAPEGEVDHMIESVEGLSAGDRVRVCVDAERRTLHARLHSAGHLIADAAVRVCPALTPSSGHHWPGEARVEFEGAPENVASFQTALEEELQALLATDLPLQLRPDEMSVRTVQIAGAPTPCGGTHVHSLREIGPIIVRRVQVKRGGLRVSYDLGV